MSMLDKNDIQDGQAGFESGPHAQRECVQLISPPLTGEGAFQLSPDHVAIHSSPDPVCGSEVLGYLSNSWWDDL